MVFGVGRSASHSTWLIGLAVGCSLLLAGCWRQAAKPGDKNLVTHVALLQPYGVELPKDFEKYESLQREQWYDGTYVIEYEFDPPKALGLPIIYSSAERQRSKSEACTSYHAGNVGLKIAGTDMRERDDLFKYGDRSRFAMLVDNGEPYGNLFSMCSGKTAFMTIIAGFYFDDGAAWKEMIDPVLQALEKESQKK